MSLITRVNVVSHSEQMLKAKFCLCSLSGQVLSMAVHSNVLDETNPEVTTVCSQNLSHP